MATVRRHQHDNATFEELDKMGQVRSMLDERHGADLGENDSRSWPQSGA
jgi:hypothetical protein